MSNKYQEYKQLLHAIQTGVALTLAEDPSSGSPKHLRVGVNSAMVNDHALVTLLVKKGIITMDEYHEELVVAARKEVEMYEQDLSASKGVQVKLL